MKHALFLAPCLFISLSNWAMETPIDPPVNWFTKLCVRVLNDSSKPVSIRVQDAISVIKTGEVRPDTQTRPFMVLGTQKVLIATSSGIYELKYNDEPPMQNSLGLYDVQKIGDKIYRWRISNMLQAKTEHGVQIRINEKAHAKLEPMPEEVVHVSNPLRDNDDIMRQLQMFYQEAAHGKRA